jgi:hypothetical protein
MNFKKIFQSLVAGGGMKTEVRFFLGPKVPNSDQGVETVILK